MSRQNYIDNYRYDFRQWNLLGFLLFTLLTGCNVDNPDEGKRPANSENGKIIEEWTLYDEMSLLMQVRQAQIESGVV